MNGALLFPHMQNAGRGTRISSGNTEFLPLPLAGGGKDLVARFGATVMEAVA